MIKPPPASTGDLPVRVQPQREIRDVHTLVAKLASEAVTLQSWTEVPPSDQAEAKLQQTISTFADGLASDATRLAGSLSEDDTAAAESEDPVERSAALPPGTGLAVDKSV